jgi:hypothetical protein
MSKWHVRSLIEWTDTAWLEAFSGRFPKGRRFQLRREPVRDARWGDLAVRNVQFKKNIPRTKSPQSAYGTFCSMLETMRHDRCGCLANKTLIVRCATHHAVREGIRARMKFA